MRSSVLSLVAAVVACALLAACSSKGDLQDDTAGWSAQRLYGEARDAMSAKEWPKAVKYFEKLEARYPYGRYAQQAQLEIAYAHWKNDESASALAAADRFIKLHPGHPNVDYAYYLKGIINFAEKEGMVAFFTGSDMSDRDPKTAQDAYLAFNEVVTRFPDSRYAADSAARMRYLVNSLAQHEVFVARYYLRRGAYLAAVNRAQIAVRNYPNAPAAEEALFVMKQSYDKLGLFDLRDDANRVLAKNFPQSPYLKGDVRRYAPWWRVWDPEW
jgi:outer membrane protein assembly factor BamD